MADWKEAAKAAHEARGPEEAAVILSRQDARGSVLALMEQVLEIGDEGIDWEAPEGDADPHIDYDGVRWYLGGEGQLWGHVETADCAEHGHPHSWDMPIRTMADAGELLKHLDDMEAGVHPDPRATPRSDVVEIGAADVGDAGTVIGGK